MKKRKDQQRYLCYATHRSYLADPAEWVTHTRQCAGCLAHRDAEYALQKVRARRLERQIRKRRMTRP